MLKLVKTILKSTKNELYHQAMKVNLKITQPYIKDKLIKMVMTKSKN